ncbi:EamA family transporter [Schaalia suimastitidis]|uniref:EamA family transporter n=1 Tax=Schaalia suimastitidis TaxID=121163 RepID=UPI000419C446|nr:EamA family transporter [Schaalia suimastitidis]
MTARPPAPQRRIDAIPAPALIVGSALSQYVGAAFAVMLFEVMPAGSVAWWRVAASAILLILWRRPWRSGLSVHDLWKSALFGIVLVTMNIAFYHAIVTLDLGVAVSLEFLGPVAVAAIGGRGLFPRLAALLACIGVFFIGGMGIDITDPDIRIGLAWIALSGAAWAGYIVLGRRIAATRSALTNLAIGCAAGALFYAPTMVPGALVALSDARLLFTVLVMAVLSTALPFSLEAIAMSRVNAPMVALLMALEPATSAVVGALLLHQFPSFGESAGLLCISMAVWLASKSMSR